MYLLKILLVTFSLALFFTPSTPELNAKQAASYYHSFNQNAKHKKKSIKRHYSYVSQKNYQQFWNRGTFPTVQDSINYHTKKHGYHRTPLQYTRDAVNFYERNKHLRYPTILKYGAPGYRIKKGNEGGVWTKGGKILTYWD